MSAVSLRKKASRNDLSLDGAAGLPYPTYFTASFDYYATGEGRTVGIVMGWAQDHGALCSVVESKFHKYFCQCVNVVDGLEVDPTFKTLVPEHVKKVIRRINDNMATYAPCAFHFTAQLHVNFS